MKMKITVLLLLLVIVLSVASCVDSKKPEGSFTTAELLENPVYNTEVKIYGKVGGLGELACTCFFLSAGGKSIHV
jgi:hypothetical protein